MTPKSKCIKTNVLIHLILDSPKQPLGSAGEPQGSQKHSQGPPGDPQDPPKDPQGPSGKSLEPNRAFPRDPRESQGPPWEPKRTPTTSCIKTSVLIHLILDSPNRQLGSPGALENPRAPQKDPQGPPQEPSRISPGMAPERQKQGNEHFQWLGVEHILL